MLFDVPGRPPAQRAKPIDGRLPRSLIELPEVVTGQVDVAAYRSLATRDLERGQGTGLPSGEAVAELMGADVLSEDELGLRHHGWQGETPSGSTSSASRPRATKATGSARSAAASSRRSSTASSRRTPSRTSRSSPTGRRRSPPGGERFGLADLLVP